jgi:iron-sulfur cluster assembly protein
MSVATFNPQAAGHETGSVIHVSDRAAHHLRAQLGMQAGRQIRLGVKESGCNGYTYTLDYVDAPAANDVVVQVTDDLQISIAAGDIALVRGTEVDYVREGLNATLKFKNANATGYCGCGESFSIAT